MDEHGVDAGVLELRQWLADAMRARGLSDNDVAARTATITRPTAEAYEPKNVPAPPFPAITLKAGEPVGRARPVRYVPVAEFVRMAKTRDVPVCVRRGSTRMQRVPRSRSTAARRARAPARQADDPSPEPLTRLQAGLELWGELRDALRDLFDEREWATFVACTTIFSASENARFVDDEWDAAEPEEWLP